MKPHGYLATLGYGVKSLRRLPAMLDTAATGHVHALVIAVLAIILLDAVPQGPVRETLVPTTLTGCIVVMASGLVVTTTWIRHLSASRTSGGYGWIALDTFCTGLAYLAMTLAAYLAYVLGTGHVEAANWGPPPATVSLQMRHLLTVPYVLGPLSLMMAFVPVASALGHDTDLFANARLAVPHAPQLLLASLTVTACALVAEWPVRIIGGMMPSWLPLGTMALSAILATWWLVQVAIVTHHYGLARGTPA